MRLQLSKATPVSAKGTPTAGSSLEVVFSLVMEGITTCRAHTVRDLAAPSVLWPQLLIYLGIGHFVGSDGSCRHHSNFCGDLHWCSCAPEEFSPRSTLRAGTLQS